MPLPMNFLVALCTQSHQILFCIITQAAARLNVMNLKILHAAARLTTPAISLQNFTAEPAVGFGVKPQAWPIGTDPSQSVT
jgi:hypothetical protein